MYGFTLHFVPLLLNLLNSFGWAPIQWRHGEVRNSYPARDRTLVVQPTARHFIDWTVLMKGQYDIKLKMINTLIIHQSKVYVQRWHTAARNASYKHFSTTSSMCTTSSQAFSHHKSKVSATPLVKNCIIFYLSFHPTHTHTTNNLKTSVFINFCSFGKMVKQKYMY